MSRKKITIGDSLKSPTSNQQVLGTAFLIRTGAVTDLVALNFMDDSITYFERTINQTFEYLLVDNIGEGQIRIAFNKLGIDLSNPIDGAKTLKSGDTLYIQDSIENLSIYFIGVSTVELILMTK